MTSPVARRGISNSRSARPPSLELARNSTGPEAASTRTVTLAPETRLLEASRTRICSEAFLPCSQVLALSNSSFRCVGAGGCAGAGVVDGAAPRRGGSGGGGGGGNVAGGIFFFDRRGCPGRRGGEAS